MYKIGDVIKVPILIIQEDSEANMGFAMGTVLGESKTVSDATELKVDLKTGYTIANIKNSQLEEANK